MSLRKKAVDICLATNPNRAWHKKLNKKQKSDLLDLVEGYKENEFSLSAAYKAFLQEYPEIKVSRSAFGVGIRGLVENDA